MEEEGGERGPEQTVSDSVDSARSVTTKSSSGSNGAASRLSGIAKMLTGKTKGNNSTRVPDKSPLDPIKDSNGLADDDLPLGSEATTLPGESSDGVDGKKVDGKAVWKRQASQAAMMGWQSFNSDASNQTSGSSASLDMLLHERQVDPEMMLLSLGFGGQAPQYVPTMARVPSRFLKQPSRAQGVATPWLAQGEDDGLDSGPDGEEDDNNNNNGSGTRSPAPAAGRVKRKPGMWTMARTLGMLRGGKRSAAAAAPSSRHLSPVDSPAGTPPSGGQGYPKSILIPANQRALASRGFYLQHGWPAGMFEEEQPVPQDPDDASKDAVSRRKMFKKTRSRRNWSLCGSGEEECKQSGSTSSEWVTKSMDDSLNREDSTGADDTLGRMAYFSTTTESSTDSLDGKNMESEKALEEIRRQFNEGQVTRRERRSSSEDLFMPNPHAHERLNDSSVFENSLPNEDDYSVEGDFLAARSKNYFISPATSRQATIEKAPSICDPSTGSALNNFDSTNDDNNNKNDIEGTIAKEEHVPACSAKRVTFPDISKLKSGGHSSSAPVSFDQSDRDDNGSSTNNNNSNNGNSKVRIIVSGSFDATGKEYWLKSQSSDSSSSAPSHLAVKEGVQRASSDSGSSSSGTAVGSSSVVADLDTLRMSESESSVTERDSISRTNSPSGFLLAASGAAQARVSSESKCETASKACQASEQDLAQTVARLAASFSSDAVNANNDNNKNNNNNIDHSNASSVVNVKVLRKGLAGTEFVLEGRTSPWDDSQHRKESLQTAEENRAIRESQLCPLPSGINPLELMKRLRRSQDELPRMGSTQSDSSGFGDADLLGVDTAPVNKDTIKTQQVGSLGSSADSNGTLASSSATAVMSHSSTGEMATQTGSDDSQLIGTTSQEDHIHPMSTGMSFQGSPETQHYITTCVIPSQTGDSSDLRPPHKGTIVHGLSKDDSFVTERETGHSDRRQTSPNILSYVSEVKYNVHDGYPTNRKEMVDQSEYNNPTQSSRARGHGRRRFVSHEATPLSRPMSLPFGHDPFYGSPVYHHELPHRSKHRRYRSQCELHVGLENLDNLDFSPARNDIPLSEELANARGPAGFSASQTTQSSIATSSEGPPTTSTPASAVGDSKKGNSVSSITMYINAKDNDFSSSSHSSPPPRYKTEAGLSHQPIAGNLSGMANSSRRTTSSVSNSDHFGDRGGWRHMSPDILEDDGILDFEEEAAYPAGFSANTSSLNRRPQGKRYSFPAATGTPRSDRRPCMVQNSRHSIPFSSAASRTMEDLEAYSSSMGESGSEFSVQSFPEDALKSGVMDAQKLARLINKPVYFRGKQSSTSHYRPRRNFREWHMMQRKKRVQEENRLLQHSIQKYKDELNAMQASFVYDTQLVYDDMTDEERDEIDELEWLWEEVKLQVSEMEKLLMSRIKSVHAGNDFHSLLSNLGVINRTIDLLKEQMYQQQISSRRIDRPEEDHHHGNQFYPGNPQERLTFLPSQTYLDDMASGSQHPHRSFSHHAHSASMSSLPAALNISLDQIKTSLLKEMKDEIKASTQKLEEDLMVKDKEIQALRQKLEQDTTEKGRTSSTQALERKPVERERAASLQTLPSSTHNRKPWEPKKESRGHRRSRSRIVGDRLVTETDV